MQDTSSEILSQAAALLVDKGYTREWADELLKAQSYSAHPDNADEWVNQILSAEAGDGDDTTRRQVLEDHHRDGIPPYEPPPHD